MLKLIILFVTTACVSSVPVTRPLSYIKVPNGIGNTAPFTGTADKMAFDESEAFLYVIGGRSETLNIFDLVNPASPTLVYTQTFNEVTDGVPKAIAVCRSGNINQLAIVFAARTRLTEGHVEIFRPFYRFDQTLPFLGRVATESDPNAVAFTSSCEKFVVTCEGLPGNVNNNIMDPIPHIDIFTRNVDAWIKTQAGLQSATGMNSVRRVYTKPNDATHSVLNDLEPSDITIDGNNNVYVTFTENNCVAKFSLDNIGSVAFYDLGYKDWNNHDSDTSDQDSSISPDRINMARHKIRSFYQPESVIAINYGANVFLATANSGGTKTYTENVEGDAFNEAVRAGTINPILFDPNMDADLRAEISNNAQLGRLFVSNLRQESDGWNSIFGFYSTLYMYGSRSWSLWDASSLAQQYDSGDDLEYEVRLYNASVFNSDCTTSSQSPPQSLDTRSTYMGPEPKAIATTLFTGGMQLLAVGSGRMGGLFLYEITESEAPGFPTGQFLSYTRSGAINGNWGALYTSGDAGTPHINDLTFADAGGQTLLMVLCSQLGVVEVHELYDGNFP